MSIKRKKEPVQLISTEETVVILIREKVDLFTEVEIKMHTHTATDFKRLALLIHRMHGGKRPGLTTEALGLFGSGWELKQKLFSVVGEEAARRVTRPSHYKMRRFATMCSGPCCRGRHQRIQCLQLPEGTAATK